LRKVFYTKYFIKNLTVIPCNFFFITKFISISYKKKIKTKLAENMNFFSSMYYLWNMLNVEAKDGQKNSNEIQFIII